MEKNEAPYYSDPLEQVWNDKFGGGSSSIPLSCGLDAVEGEPVRLRVTGNTRFLTLVVLYISVTCK